MNDSSSPISPTGAVAFSARAGLKLRQIRERLNMTLRAVEEASMEIAGAEGSSDFVVSTAG